MPRNAEGNSIVGEYNLVRQLGVANLSRFFLAVHRLNLTTHIVRVMHKGVLDRNCEIRDIFYTELSALRAHDHPSFASLTDILEDARCVYVVTAHIKGPGFFERHLVGYTLQRSSMSESFARRIFHQIVNIALVLQRQGVPHWFKLENIVQVSTEKLMLATFRSPEDEDGILGLPKEIMILPKHYKAPELEGMNSYTSSGNTWACGVALYALVTGRLPTNSRDLLQKKGRPSVSFPTSAQISEDGQHLLHRLLQRDFKKRMRLCDIPSHPWFAEGILHPDNGAVLVDGSWSKLISATRSNSIRPIVLHNSGRVDEPIKIDAVRSKQGMKSVCFGQKLPSVFRSKEVKCSTTRPNDRNIVSDAELMRSVMSEVEQVEQVKRRCSFHGNVKAVPRKPSFSVSDGRKSRRSSEAVFSREKKVRWWSNLRLRSPIAIRREHGRERVF